MFSQMILVYFILRASSGVSSTFRASSTDSIAGLPAEILLSNGLNAATTVVL